MARDPRVEAAIAHWAPRFIANGIPYPDFVEVTQGLTDWDEWCPAWSARAAIHEHLGHQALEAGLYLSAGEHLSTAAVCYHFGKFLFVHDIETMRATHEKAVACRTMALPHLSPKGERIEIPYQGSKLFGNLRLPDNIDKPPIVLMASGLDSAKEEMDAYESIFLARGLATLSFDGPGQGEAEYEFAVRADYEVAVTTIIDQLESLGRVDCDRIGMWGVSFGGYYAPRAAAFESRIKACIALSGPFNWYEIWEKLPPLTREAFRVRSHSDTLEDAREFARTIDLNGVAEKITCPLFIVTGKLDRIIPYQDAERLAAAVKGETELLIIEDGNHVSNNRGYLYRTQTADWIAAKLREL